MWVLPIGTSFSVAVSRPVRDVIVLLGEPENLEIMLLSVVFALFSSVWGKPCLSGFCTGSPQT